MLNIIPLLWSIFGFLSFGIVGGNYVLARRAAKKAWQIRKDNNYTPKISIIIPTYNECEVIECKLRNLSKLEYPRDLLQIVFIDGQSKDTTIERIKDFAGGNPNLDIKIIVENQRKGKSAALNTALKDCVGDVVVVSDADCFWPSRILNESLPYLADTSVGAISGPKKLLNAEDSWVTRTECKYLESMNLMKLGESKTASTILSEGGFAAFKKSTLDSFDPYNTGSDDCGTVISILEKNKRAIMIPEAEFYTFFPKSWKGRTEIKIRRALQLVRVLQAYLMLLSKGRIKTMKKTVIKTVLLYLVAPIMFLFFVITTFILILTFPFAILCLSVFLIPRLNTYLADATLSYFTMLYAIFSSTLGKRSLVWKKPSDRKLLREEALLKAGLI